MRKNAACFRKRRFFHIFHLLFPPHPIAIAPAHYPGGAMSVADRHRGARLGLPRPCPSPLRTAPHCVAVRITRAPSPDPFAIRSRCGRARCPHRAAAPHGAVRRLASRFRCAVPRCRPVAPYRHSPHALPVRRDGDIAPYRHYTRKIRPSTAQMVRGFAPRPYPSRCAATPASHAPPCRAPTACRGSRPAFRPNRQTPFSRPDATSFALLRSIRAIADFLLFC